MRELLIHYACDNCGVQVSLSADDVTEWGIPYPKNWSVLQRPGKVKDKHYCFACATEGEQL